MRLLPSFFLVALLLLSTVRGALCASIAVETFNYPVSVSDNSIHGKNGGSGWAGPWSVLNAKTGFSETLQSTSLLDYPGLTETGNRLHWWTATGGSTTQQIITRSFLTPITDSAARTYWMAFEIQESIQKFNANIYLNGYAPSLIKLWVSNSTPAAPSYYFLGDFVSPSTAPSASNLLIASSTGLQLFLFKITMSGSAGVNDSIAIYVNPNLALDVSALPPTATRTVDLHAGFSGISLKANNNGNTSSVAKFDEFRLADSWQEAVGKSAVTDTTPPSIPMNLKYYAPTLTSWCVSWDPSSDNVGVVGYDVYRTDQSGNLLPGDLGLPFVSTVGANATSVIFNGVVGIPDYIPEPTYCKITAKDAAGNVSAKSVVLLYTDYDVINGGPIEPTAPQNASVEVLTSTSIRVSWTAATDDTRVNGYLIYRQADLVQVFIDHYIDGAGTNFSFVDTGLAPSTGYTYQINSIDQLWTGSPLAITPVSGRIFTPPAGNEIPSVPTNFVATTQSSSSINLTWTASTDNIAVKGYQITRGAVTINVGNVTSYTDVGLNSSTLYTYTIKSKDGAGNMSASSSSASATTYSASSAPIFVVGVNMNGAAVTIGGNLLKAYTTALTQGLSVAGPSGSLPTLGTTGVVPTPASVTDANAVKDMLQSVVWAAKSFTVSQPVSVPVGGTNIYNVYLWVMENYSNPPTPAPGGLFRKMNVKMEGVTVATGIGYLPLGSWAKYGPYTVSVTDGTLNIALDTLVPGTSSTYKGNPMLSGFEVYSLPPSIASLPTLLDSPLAFWNK